MKQLDLNNKKVLLRVDFNVPLDAENQITDDTRIRAAIPTIKYILEGGGRIILLSHLGRPQKKKNEDGSLKRNTFSLIHTLDRLAELSGVPVHFIDDTRGEAVRQAAAALKKGEILILENTRFYKEESAGDHAFAKQLSELADIYINDAFGTAHRAHASTATVASFFKKDEKGFGFLMQRELDNAAKLIHDPEGPFVAILGGAKVSDKIQLIDALLYKVDKIIVGGGMAYTFVKASGGQIGKSLVEEDKLELALALINKAEQNNVELLIPADSNCAQSFDKSAIGKIFPSDAIPDDYMGLDIGVNAIASASNIIASARTIFWNGPMGVFEFPQFADGTLAVAKAVAAATENGAYSLVGGGDSVAAINQTGLADKVSFISTGGGAMLTLLEGGQMPGIKGIEE